MVIRLVNVLLNLVFPLARIPTILYSIDISSKLFISSPLKLPYIADEPPSPVGIGTVIAPGGVIVTDSTRNVDGSSDCRIEPVPKKVNRLVTVSVVLTPSS